MLQMLYTSFSLLSLKEKTGMIFITQLNQSEQEQKFSSGSYFHQVCYHSLSWWGESVQQIFVMLPWLVEHISVILRPWWACNEQAGVLECGFGDSDLIVGNETNSFGWMAKRGLLTWWGNSHGLYNRAGLQSGLWSYLFYSWRKEKVQGSFYGYRWTGFSLSPSVLYLDMAKIC